MLAAVTPSIATDVIFAIDSIPAILAISRSQFIVFASNAFAILGLRALYFMLAGLKDRLVYLNKGLGVILFYVGVKMLVSNWYHIPTLLSLGVIALVLTVTVIASLRATSDDEHTAEQDAQPQRQSVSVGDALVVGPGQGTHDRVHREPDRDDSLEDDEGTCDAHGRRNAASGGLDGHPASVVDPIATT